MTKLLSILAAFFAALFGVTKISQDAKVRRVERKAVDALSEGLEREQKALRAARDRRVKRLRGNT